MITVTLIAVVLAVIGSLGFYVYKVSKKQRSIILFADHLTSPPEKKISNNVPLENPTHWKLLIDEGRQNWKYHSTPQSQTKQEQYELGILPELPRRGSETNATPVQALSSAINFYSSLQTEDGHWANDYGGPMFLMPGAIFTCYISNTKLGDAFQREMIRYLRNQQNKDGGWGLHIESGSTIFGSVLSYVSLRLLGVPADDSVCVEGRAFISKYGGPAGIPSWGKLWLATLGLYSWDGVNPINPEMWLLPYSVPIHPGRLWCHARMVYLPMAYLYGARCTYKGDALVDQIKNEIWDGKYNSVQWSLLQDECAPIDRYVATSMLLNGLNKILRLYERFRIPSLRQAALNETIKHIKYDDVQTKFINIGPVNKTMNMLSVWFFEGNSDHFKQHVPRLYDYLWLSKDGVKMQGYNGCQLWDTAFASQAISVVFSNEKLQSDMASLDWDKKQTIKVLQQAYNYIDITQVKEDYPRREEHYHHIAKGAWPFSTRDHGWPIADCTGEGLRAAFAIEKVAEHEPMKFNHEIDYKRKQDAVNVMLSFQNKAFDNGWPTYELQRGGSWFELLNPSEVFGEIMVDYSYVELSGAVMRSFIDFLDKYPLDERKVEIETALITGTQYLVSQQRNDGSWRGSWAVCFSYGTWFAIDTIQMVRRYFKFSHNGIEDLVKEKGVIQRCFGYLKGLQNKDGGWGEAFASCVQKRWVNHVNGSQVVNTAWCLLTLMKMRKESGVEEGELRRIVERGVRFLVERQLVDGDWKLEGISGVFNANCSISYNSYKNIFTIWALAVYEAEFK